MGLVIASALPPNSGVDVAGSLPASLQTWVNFAAGLSSAAGDAKAAETFVKFLRSPAMAAALKAQPGLEPAP
jgi:ABC-type molybdate transport system substrate-binding protein